MPGRPENRASEKGESHAKAHGSESVKSIEHVGSSGPHGIRFKVHNHPDKSEVHKELKE